MAEVEGGGYKPHIFHEKFDAGHQRKGPAEKDKEQFNPYSIAVEICCTLDDYKREYKKNNETFNEADWIHVNMLNFATESSYTREERRFFREIYVAYGLLAHSRFSPELQRG